MRELKDKRDELKQASQSSSGKLEKITRLKNQLQKKNDDLNNGKNHLYYSGYI